MKIKKSAMVVLTFFLMSTLLSAEESVVRVGTEGTWRPFSYRDAAGDLTGFEVELVRAACEKAKTKCEIVVVPWESLIPALQEGRIDAIASGMRMTEKRRKVVDFSIPYYINKPMFASCKHKDLADSSQRTLDGMVVGVQVGSTHFDFLTERYDGLNIRAYKNVDDIYADLRSGRLDLAYGSKATSFDFLNSEDGRNCTFVGAEIQDAEFYSDPTAMAVRKGDVETKMKLDLGVSKILTDGTFEEINARYWPFSIKYNDALQ